MNNTLTNVIEISLFYSTSSSARCSFSLKMTLFAYHFPCNDFYPLSVFGFPYRFRGTKFLFTFFFCKERKQKVSISYNFETCNQRTSIHFENNKQDETLRDFGTLYISFPLPVICWVTRSCDKSVITWCWNDGTCFTAWNIWRIFRFYLLD